MFTKRNLLLAGAGILLIVAIIFTIYTINKNKNAPTSSGQTPGQQAGSAPVSGSGGLLQVQPSPLYDARGDLIVKSDPTKPFASIAPRAKEPTSASTAAGSPSNPASINFQDYNKAVASGLIPDQNGLYTQVIDPSGFSPQDRNTNYALGEDQFLQQYYPEAQSIINSSDPTSQENQSSPDAIAIVPSAPLDSNGAVDIVAGADPSLFKTTAATDPTTVRYYVVTISKAAAAFDILHDDLKISSLILKTHDSATLLSYQAQAKAVQAKIVAIIVPEPLLGLSEAYYQAYQAYQNYIDQLMKIAAAESSATLPANTDLSGYNKLSSAMDDLSSRVSQLKAYVQANQ